MANGMMNGVGEEMEKPKVGTTTYKRPYLPGSVGSADEAQKFGLGTAKDILAGTAGREVAYPEDITGQLKGPAQRDFYQNVAYDPLQTLTGGDYEALQSALEAPIREQDRLAQNRIADVYSGRGLYGSAGGGFMSGAQAAQTGATQSALGTATANRYALQQKEQQAKFAADAAAADQLNRYRQQELAYGLGQDQRAIDFYNQQLAAQQQYQLDKQRFIDAQDQIAFDRAAQLAGLGTSGAGLAAQQDIARQQAQAAQTGALYQGLGALGGGLLGAYGDEIASGVGSAASGVSDWLADLF